MTGNETGHHRINERLNAYWEKLRGRHAMPKETDIALEDIKELWPNCFLINVKDGAFSYSYLGDRLIEAYGDDLTGKEIAQALVYPHPPSLVKTFAAVAASGSPCIDENEFVNSRGATVKYRSCVLPLAGSDGTAVAFLLGGMNWKAF